MPDSAFLYKEIRTHPRNPGSKVFCFFFSKKTSFLHPCATRPGSDKKEAKQFCDMGRAHSESLRPDRKICLMHLYMHLSDRQSGVLADGLLYLSGVGAVCDDGGGDVAARGGGGFFGGNLA